MSAADLLPGRWYRYHGQPALFLGRDPQRQYNFEITTACGRITVRVSARGLQTEITTL